MKPLKMMIALVLNLMVSVPLMADLPGIRIYKSPTCDCCTKWAKHLEDNGFHVDVVNTGNMQTIKDQQGIGTALRSCHTATVDGYVIEGHVPADDIRRLLEMRPAIKGLAVPGMPIGSPGMEVPGGRSDRYRVMAIEEDGGTHVFANH